MRLKLSLRCLVLSVMFVFAQDASAQWVPTSGPLVLTVTCMAHIGTNLFIGTDGQGVYLSIDQGVSWNAVNNGVTDGLISGMTTVGSEIVAGTINGTLYRSSNNGASWDTALVGDEQNWVNVLSSDGTDLYAATSFGAGVYRSSDQGAHWTTQSTGLPNPPKVTTFAVGGTTASPVLFAGTLNNGVYVSTDRGGSWHASSSVSTGYQLYSLAASGTSVYAGFLNAAKYLPLGVSVSTDNGATWKQSNTGLPDSSLAYTLLESGSVMLVSTDVGVFVSNNGGSTWSKANVGLGALAMTSFDVVGSAPTNFFSGTGADGIIKSTDNGATWAHANAGIASTTGVSTVVTIPTSSGGSNVLAGCIGRASLLYPSGAAVFFSSDEGASWSAIPKGIDGTSIRASIRAGTKLFGAALYAIDVSIDSGVTWKANYMSAVMGTGRGGATSFALSGTNLFAGSPLEGVMRTTDEGGTWNHVNTGLTDTAVYSLAVEAAGTASAKIFAGTSSGVFISADKGSSWHAVNSGLPSTIISAMASVSTGPNTNDVFAGTNAGIYATVYDGTSWTLVQPTPVSQSIAMLTAIGTNLLAGTAKGIALSTNNGANWTDVSLGLPSGQVSGIAEDATNLFVATGANGVWRRPIAQLIGQGVSSEEQLASPSLRTYPNPFTKSVTLTVSAESGHTSIAILNMLGEEVAQLFSGELAAGEHSFTWDASGLPVGMYICVVRRAGQVEQLPMIRLE